MAVEPTRLRAYPFGFQHSAVRFGESGVDAQVLQFSPTQLHVRVPEDAGFGPIFVTNRRAPIGTVRSTDGYTVR
jgi:hypothetical protein